jgi:hypothetical protein
MSKQAKGNNKPQPIALASLVAHALCDTVPGGMTEDEYAALVSDLQANGMRIPIVLYEGHILDGRARYRAAKQAKVEIKYEEFNGTEDQARDLVMSTNLQRRTLTGMQKALAVAERYRAMVNSDGPKPSQEAMAKRYGVSKQTINLCVKALESKNTMLLTRMRRGEVTRGELEEEFYDRTAANATTSTDATVDEAQDLFGSAPAPGDTPVDFSAAAGKGGGGPLSRGAKATGDPKRAKETPASVCAAQFKALSADDRTAFVALAWPWLEAPVRAHVATSDAMGKASTKAAAPKTKGKATAKA